MIITLYPYYPPRTFISNTASHFRVSLEPLIPSELPKMLQVLRLLGLLYPEFGDASRGEGEHVLLCPGWNVVGLCPAGFTRNWTSTKLDCHDPSASLCETVSEQSTLKCFADTANGKLRIIQWSLNRWKRASWCESSGGLPAESVLIDKFRMGSSVLPIGQRQSQAVGGSVLIDDTFDESLEGLLPACRASLLQGISMGLSWGTPVWRTIRELNSRLLSLSLQGGEMGGVSACLLSPAQIVPACRRSCYAAFWLHPPPFRTDPVNFHFSPPATLSKSFTIYSVAVIGHILSDLPLPVHPVLPFKHFLPLLDSPGFEVDLRSMTAGTAFPTPPSPIGIRSRRPAW